MNTTELTRSQKIEILADAALEGWRVGRELGASEDMIEAAVAEAFQRLLGLKPGDASLISAIAKCDDLPGWIRALGGNDGELIPLPKA